MQASGAVENMQTTTREMMALYGGAPPPPAPALAPARRGEGARMVDAIREDRRRLCRAIRKLADAYPFRDEARSAGALSDACRILSAYTAMSHFGAFRRIAEGEERRANVRRVAVVVYPTIDASTQQILRFDSHYRYTNPWAMGRRLTRDLSALGKGLYQRFRLEERLLAEMDPP